ncbi:L-aspartate oxidase [Metabacillus malikii]|uniref:L-aspartate oxidase n=1 Tax=Metabacillus malikii TaxID=1504265 RepID=A0ABT9ZKN8_9BACI|nr:L-aspartate oxidase [Metabacillus malikii]MDQ0232844.1 L-aspartate oxidase [Metabacillus malikii]
MPQTDVIIIGSGIAALSAAYYLKHKNVIVITKSSWTESNSMLAQGGIAAAIHKNDSWKNHYEDTLIAGCHHNNKHNVKKLVTEGPIEIVKWCKNGMTFDTDNNNQFLLGKEGAHSHNRILHAGGDATGREMTMFLYNKIKSKAVLIENEMALDLIIENGTCLGVRTKANNGALNTYLASKTIVASGGCGAVYGHTSNADVITGDGIAMAFRAGAEITDMEFIQFHPTMLNIEGRCVGLISEAVRGEGAVLINDRGEAFMHNIHHQKDLAPRDVVSRAIFEEMKKGHNVYLDISPITNFKERFPTVSNICRENGVNIEHGKLPVAPGMHFLMGGIRTNDKGETSIKDLFAIGETACTGVHGANRLASNSLLEGLVFGKNVASHILSVPFEKRASYSIDEGTDSQGQKLNLPTRKHIQRVMSEYVGIQRTEAELTIAVNWFKTYQSTFFDLNVKNLTREEMETINLLTIGWLISSSALKRTESRGGHYRLDFPYTNDNEWNERQIIRTKEEMYAEV